MRALSVVQVEYEIFNHIINNVDLSELYEDMVVDDVTKIRFNKGATNAVNLIRNLSDRRRHKLPKNHTDRVDR